MLKTIYLDYDFSKIVSADYTQHSGSCISHQVHELTDIHEQYGGFPNTYCYENTIIHQLWWTLNDLDFDKIGRQLNRSTNAILLEQNSKCGLIYILKIGN